MTDKDTARIIRPENKLKKKIGADVNVREILQPEVVQSAQQIIMDKKDSFLQEALESLRLLEESYHHLHQGSTDAAYLTTMSHEAELLRDRSGTFGYYLGSDIAKSLARYCEQSKKNNEHFVVVIRKHLDGLQTVFKQNVLESGGTIGMELMHGLRLLIEKYPPVAAS